MQAEQVDLSQLLWWKLPPKERSTCAKLIARVLCNKQDCVAYARAFKEVFSWVIKTYPEFKNGKSLQVISVHFDNAQAKGLNDVLGEENSKRVYVDVTFTGRYAFTWFVNQ